MARVTGLSRNVVYKIHRKLLNRLRQLAGSYATDGKLRQQVQAVLQAGPPARVQRSVTERVTAKRSGKRDRYRSA